MIDPTGVLTPREFRIIGGNYIADDPEDLTYIDTVFMLSGLVWHVFELDQQP